LSYCPSKAENNSMSVPWTRHSGVLDRNRHWVIFRLWRTCSDF